MPPPALSAISGVYHFSSKLARVMGSPFHFRSLKMLYYFHTVISSYLATEAVVPHRTLVFFHNVHLL
jgi:hypothetical protein